MATSPDVPTIKVSRGHFDCPNALAENLHLFKLSASKDLALLYFRRAQEWGGSTAITGTIWETWTGHKSRVKKYAMKELGAFGFNFEGSGNTLKCSWDEKVWLRTLATRPDVKYDPKREDREQKAKELATNAHQDCVQNGCWKARNEQAKEKGTDPVSPVLVMPVVQPVANVERSNPIPSTRPAEAKPKTEKPEIQWARTLSAMRDGFASAGVKLLLELISTLMVIFKLNPSDYVLAEAVKVAYAESRGRWNSPVMLLKTVPDVLAGWKAKGQPMDDTGEDEAAPRVWKKPTQSTTAPPGRKPIDPSRIIPWADEWTKGKK